MSNLSFQFKMNLGIVIITLIILVWQVRKVGQKQKKEYVRNLKKNVHNRYVFYTNNVFTRKKFRRIVTRYSSMACYDLNTIKTLSVQLFEKAITIVVVLPILGLITYRNVALALLILFVAMIWYDLTIDRAIDKVYLSIQEDCALVIQSIRDNYKVTDSIPRAVLDCERSTYMQDAVEKMHDILTDVNGDELLWQFKRTSPVRIVGTLADVLYISNDEGDTKYADGPTAFERAMSALRAEADSESLILLRTETMFKALDKLALVGLIVSPIADWYLLKYMPGTSLYLKGMYGFYEKTFLIGATILTYYAIATLRRPSVVNQVDMVEWIQKLSRRYKVKKFINRIIPKTFKAKRKWELKLRSAISTKTMEYIYTAKIIYSAFAGALATALLIVFTISAKVNLYNNYESLSMTKSGTKMTEREYNALKRMDREYLSMSPRIDDEATRQYVKSKLGLSDYETELQADRLTTKYDKYYSIGFKWYYVLIVYASMVAGWFAIELSIALRIILVRKEESQDVMQLQSIMVTISNTNMDTLQALYWLMVESTIHKAPLRYAYLEYPSDPEMALIRLKDSVGSKELKRMITKLEKTIIHSSIREAFDDIHVDKQQYLIRHEAAQLEDIKSRKEYARLISSIPVGTMIFLGFVGPIAMLGISTLMAAFSQMPK